MKIESKFLVNHYHTDEVMGEIGVVYDDNTITDHACLEFTKGKWKLDRGFVKGVKENDQVFVLLDDEKIDDLIRTLELIKEQI